MPQLQNISNTSFFLRDVRLETSQAQVFESKPEPTKIGSGFNLRVFPLASKNLKEFPPSAAREF